MTKLNERAMLVQLKVSTYSGMMTDKEVTEEVNESYKADKKQAGRYNKRLINSKFFTGVSSAHGVAKKVHRVLTLPWEDDGTRILTTRAYIAYTERMRECRRKCEDEVKAFVEGLPEYIEEAKVRLAQMFNADDYPTQEELASKFGFDVEVKQVPDATDFRANLSDDQVKAIVKDIEKRGNERLERAVNDVFERVADVVRNMSEKLREYQPSKDGKKATGIIRDAIVYNIHELTETLPLLNVTGDKRIEDLQHQLADELVEHSPEILRDDAKIRQQTISKADKILKKVEAYMK